MSDPVAAFAKLSPALYRMVNDTRLAVGAPFRAGAHGHGPRNRDRVALTFDDGPDPRWTPKIIEALHSRGARATFFMLGEAVVRHPELARSVAAAHQVGTHSHTHARRLAQSANAMLDDLEHAAQVHETALGERPRIVRFPFGDAGKVSAAELTDRGLVAYHWTFASLDTRWPPDRIARRFDSLIAPGDIVLLHDGVGPDSRLGPGHRDHTVAVLPDLLAVLERRGLQAVTLDELFAA